MSEATTGLTLDERRKLNAEIVVAVFGWKRITDDIGELWQRPDGAKCSDLHVPDFSGNIADAWLIVEQMKADGWSFALWEVPPMSSVLPMPTAGFRYGVHPPVLYGEHGVRTYLGSGETSPLAIALAARAAAGGQGDGR